MGITGDDPIPSKGPTPDEVDHDTHSEFLESFNTTVLLDAASVVDELKTAKNNKIKRFSEKLPTHSGNTIKGEITQCVESFIEVAETLIIQGQTTTPNDALRHSIKAASDILNNTEGVKMASPFWVNVTEVLKNETKRTLWLQMRQATRLPWLIKQVDKMN